LTRSLRSNLTKTVRASAHEPFFGHSGEAAAAAEHFLVVLTDGERNATFSHFVHYLSVCAVAVCAVLLRTRTKRRKWFWVHPLAS